MKNIWHAILESVLPLVARAVATGVVAALVATGLVMDGDGRLPVELPPAAQLHGPSGSSSSKSPLQRLSLLFSA